MPKEIAKREADDLQTNENKPLTIKEIAKFMNVEDTTDILICLCNITGDIDIGVLLAQKKDVFQTRDYIYKDGKCYVKLTFEKK